MHKLVPNGHFAGGPPNLKGTKYFDLLFATIIHSPNPTFVPSLSEIGDLSCITCLGYACFFMDAFFTGYFPHIRTLGREFVTDKTKWIIIAATTNVTDKRCTK